MTKEEFIKKAKLVHKNNYSYELVIYENNKTKVKIICNKCNNIFEQRPDNHLNGQNCPYCFGIKKTTKEQFIKKANKIHNNKYDYSLIDYKNMNTKVKILCKNCNNIFEQKPTTHINVKHGCPFCVKNKKLTKEEFVERAKLIHNNKYDYSLVIYKNMNTKVKIICSKCGKIFEQSPNDHLNGSGCNCVYKGEEKIIKFLKSNNIKFEQTKKYTDLKDKRNLSYDFYIPKNNLLIEYNGKQHYSNIFNKSLHEWHRQLHHDWLKRKYARDNNIELLIVSYNEFENIERILIDKIIKINYN